jgi:hypothetical protein
MYPSLSLSKGAAVNDKYINSIIAVYYNTRASFEGHMDVVDILLSKGASINMMTFGRAETSTCYMLFTISENKLNTTFVVSGQY